MSPKCILFSCLFALCCLLDSRLSADADATGSSWQAQWIGSETTGSNSWLCFRKTVSLKTVPAVVEACIAVDSKYWLWINGKPAVFEGGLKRGPTPEDTYYDRVDIAPYLQRGDNTIALLVWYWGKSGFSHNSSGKAGLLFQAQAGEETIASDATWKVFPHPAYGQGGPPYPNYRLSEHNIQFDARTDIPGWFRSGFDDGNWPDARSFGTPPVTPWNELERRPIPEWRNSGLKNYVHISKSHTNDEQVWEAILPYNAQVTPWLRVKAPAGCQIDMRTDDYVIGDSTSVRSVYITRAGVQEFESLGWMNGHRIIYHAPAGVEILAVKYRETGYAADFVGDFHCDDPALNTLWQKARRTLYVTMRDNYMDCPDRERAQWWGDMVNELGESFYVFDATNGPLLARKGIRELARWHRADQTLYAPIPSGRPVSDALRKDLRNGAWNAELPPQMLASVGFYGFWTYYLYTADRDTIALAYPHVRDYLKVWLLAADGLVLHRAGDWDWEDWGENIDAPIIDSAWYSLALKGAIQMAHVCGQEADITEWQDRQTAITKNFNAKFWNGHEYRSPGYHGDTDDRANALAVLAGFAGADQFPALREVFAQHRNASPYMEKYVVEALYRMGQPEQAIQRMKIRWKDQIESWTTTLWEGWGTGFEKYGGGTYNHGWSGGALTVLSEFAAGIAPDEPAFRTYHVLPYLGKLKSVHAVVPTPNGSIKMSIEKEGDRIKLKLNSPVGTTALVGVPSPPGKKISKVMANGVVVWPAQNATGGIAGVKFQSADACYLHFMAAPGQWSFVEYFE